MKSRSGFWKRLKPINFQIAGVAITAILVLAGIMLGLQQIDQKTSPLRDGSDRNTTLILKASDKTNTNRPLENDIGATDLPDYSGISVTPLDRHSEGSNLFRIEGSLEYYDNGSGGAGS